MISCTFAGHRKIYTPDLKMKLHEVIVRLLTYDDSFVFYNGGKGEFDRLCASEVNQAKLNFPQLSIRHCLVIPYLYSDFVKMQIDQNYFDEIILPSELDNIHYKAAIKKRNEWMVDRSNFIIAGVTKRSGGAYSMLQYAHRAGKKIIMLSALKEI